MLKKREGVYVESPIHLWFGLSYASWLTMPRVLMEDMPLEWQTKMAALLREYDETFTFPNFEHYGTRVQTTHKGKLVKTPEWLTGYRRPDKEAIAKCRSERFLTAPIDERGYIDFSEDGK